MPVGRSGIIERFSYVTGLSGQYLSCQHFVCLVWNLFRTFGQETWSREVILVAYETDDKSGSSKRVDQPVWNYWPFWWNYLLIGRNILMTIVRLCVFTYMDVVLVDFGEIMSSD